MPAGAASELSTAPRRPWSAGRARSGRRGYRDVRRCAHTHCTTDPPRHRARRSTSPPRCPAPPESGYREILGICEGAKEDKSGWSEFLKHLKERGLKGIRLITSDACIGLAESAAEFFPDAAWQRCVVHWYRNIFSHVPSTKVREIAAMLKAIHASEDIAAAREKAIRVIEKLRGLRLTRAAELVEAAIEETLAYYAFPEEHWRRIRTNNPLERILREIRRRTRVVGAFPDGQSALNLAAARLRHIAA